MQARSRTDILAIIDWQLVPVFAQALRVLGFALEVFCLRIALDLVQQRWLEHLALVQLRQELQHLVPVQG